MTVVNAWLILSIIMLLVGIAAFVRMLGLFRVVRPDEEDLREEVWSRLRPLVAFIVAELFFGVAAAVVQYLPPSWNARYLTLPFLFAGQLIWFAYAVRLWWELEGIFEGWAYRRTCQVLREIKAKLRRNP